MTVLFSTLLLLMLTSVAYIALVFIIVPLLLPHMRGIRYQELPDELQRKVDALSEKHQNDRELVRALYDLLKNRLRGQRSLQFIQPHKLFIMSPKKVWEQGGVQSCNVLNMMMAQVLFASGRFGRFDIRIRTTNIFMNIHQYIQVKVDKTWISIDLWGHAYDVPFGQYAHGSPFSLGQKNAKKQ